MSISVNIPQGLCLGGQFQLPEGTELVSAVYGYLCLSHFSNQSEIQQCLHLFAQDEVNYLSFVTALRGQFNLNLNEQYNN